ncbi:MAG: DUF885 domain-containing protein [Acidimicrobiales bacterium]
MAERTLAPDEPVGRYMELGLRLGRHLDGMVDAYYGPADLAARVEAEPRRELAALVSDARSLVAALDAGDGDLGPVRRRWLRAQVAGLHTSARKLAGADVAFLDEVEQCYGVRPEWVDHEVFAAAHRRLDAALPGSGPSPASLAARYDTWRRTHDLPVERVEAVVSALAEVFRERTAATFGLPDGEAVRFELVSNEPWSGFNYYEGGLCSRVAINTDLPLSSTAVGHLIAHEAYPGHHTEHCRKEVGLVRRRHQLEESIFLVGTPQCLMAEGLADLALEALLGPDHEPLLAEILHPLGVRYDAEVVAAVGTAAESLSSVRGNAALLLHDRGGTGDDAISEMERWALFPHDRAAKSVAFLTHPTWRAYIFCYVAGLPLCRGFVAGDPARFDDLLSRQLTPADLMA